MPKVKKLYLSNHTLDVDIHKFDYDKFDFSEVEDFVRELVGTREYQYQAIKKVMIYLWGGGYKDISQLALENYVKKEAIRRRFQSKENFLRQLPLPNRLSGVVHLATGTGKSYVIFAIAYLSIILGKTKRVLVLGPSSTVIESGLRGKFKEYLYGQTAHRLQQKLPVKYHNIPINLLDENQPIVDNSIVIENINSIYNKDRNSIGDTLFSQTDEVLVLSDEVHHAYSHLSFSGNAYILEEGGKGEDRDERLWMKFLREEPKIKRHIGFTGTPYNQDEYFADVICNYSIKDAAEEKIIKKINPIIHTKIEGEKETISRFQKYEQILITHYENKEKYSYRDNKGRSYLKPITIFINPTCARAQKNTEEFIKDLSEYLKNTHPEYQNLSISELDSLAREKVICVISKPTDDDYQEKLEQVEELNPEKPGGKVEFIFAVNKLSEGWDVDNVYQIVPMEERVFKSKLLISQVLGRGLRLPRKVPNSIIQGNYPVVTITNHERFAAHIEELMFAVTDCEARFTSRILENGLRTKHNLHLFNLEYQPGMETEETTSQKHIPQNRTLILTCPSEKLHLKVDFLLGQKRFDLTKEFYTLDEVATEIVDRFKCHQFENEHFDFGIKVEVGKLADFDYIKGMIKTSMQNAGFRDSKLSKNNRQQINIFFNQFFSQGTKKPKRINIDGKLLEIKTEKMDASSIRSGELDKYTSVFISEDYQQELEEENKFVIDYLAKRFKEKPTDQLTLNYFMPQEKSDYFRQLIKDQPIFAVNTSLFKTPQNLVILSHEPEKEYVFNLIKYAKYLDSWIKSRDMGFYSLDYEFFKGGKDRTRRSFNPDFFVKINLENYIKRLTSDHPGANLTDLQQLQNEGIENIIRAVEIKSDEDQEEVTRAKEKWGKDHFKRLNKKLKSEDANPADFPDEFHSDVRSIYYFELLRPMDYDLWFSNLQKGIIWVK